MLQLCDLYLKIHYKRTYTYTFTAIGISMMISKIHKRKNGKTCYRSKKKDILLKLLSLWVLIINKIMFLLDIKRKTFI